MGRLEGKVTIVTGGAGGIGTGTCQLLARDGAAVVVADLPGSRPGELADRLVSDGHRAIGVEVDVSDEDQVRAMVEATTYAFGGVDGLHANAAATHLVRTDGLLTELSRAEFEQAFQVNVIGVWLCAKHVIPSMLTRGGGSIVATASLAAVYADMDKTAYGVTKAGLGQLMRAVATQFGKQGIRANTILPGLITHQRMQMPDSFREPILPQVLTPRFGNAESIGSLVAYLFSDESFYLQGQCIQVDGGMTAHSPFR